MLKTYLYLPETLHSQINTVAQSFNKSKAETMRLALEHGLAILNQQKQSSGAAMLKVRDVGRQYTVKGHPQSSQKIDEQMWSKDWSRDE